MPRPALFCDDFQPGELAIIEPKSNCSCSFKCRVYRPDTCQQRLFDHLFEVMLTADPAAGFRDGERVELGVSQGTAAPLCAYPAGFCVYAAPFQDVAQGRVNRVLVRYARIIKVGAGGDTLHARNISDNSASVKINMHNILACYNISPQHIAMEPWGLVDDSQKKIMPPLA